MSPTNVGRMRTSPKYSYNNIIPEYFLIEENKYFIELYNISTDLQCYSNVSFYLVGQQLF